MSLVPTSARWRRGCQPTPNEARLMHKLNSQGIRFHKSRHPQKCQLCWKHRSRFRRKCPICENFIAPGCWPVLCWSDELNHCRDCHTLIGTLKHIRFKLQYMTSLPGMDRYEHLRFKLGMATKTKETAQETQSNVISYKHVPLGVQLNIMVYLFQTKDFLWSTYYTFKHTSTPTCGCPSCAHHNFQSTDDNISYFPLIYNTITQSWNNASHGVSHDGTFYEIYAESCALDGTRLRKLVGHTWRGIYS